MAYTVMVGALLLIVKLGNTMNSYTPQLNSFVYAFLPITT